MCFQRMSERMKPWAESDVPVPEEQNTLALVSNRRGAFRTHPVMRTSVPVVDPPSTLQSQCMQENVVLADGEGNLSSQLIDLGRDWEFACTILGKMGSGYIGTGKRFCIPNHTR